jgi:phenylpropionate dioxygenase-like ring-hydroxylating dioxygenase large terminal subunit
LTTASLSGLYIPALKDRVFRAIKIKGRCCCYDPFHLLVRGRQALPGLARRVNWPHFEPHAFWREPVLVGSAPREFAAPASAGLNDPLLLREWFLVAWSSEIGRNQALARKLLGRDLVLWRSGQGLHCWLDLCVHRGARLSLGTVRSRAGADCGPAAGMDDPSSGGRTDCLICPYHAWEYAPTGQCVRIPAHPDLKPPAKARAHVFDVQERYGAVWVCVGQPDGDPPRFEPAATEGFRTLTAGPYRFCALGPRVIENALDVSHLGSVHAGLLGDSTRLEVEDYETEEKPRGPEARRIRIWQPNPDGTGRGALVTYRYWVDGPLTMGFEKTGSEGFPDGRRFAVMAQVAPSDDEHCEMRLLMSMNYGHEVPEAELRAFQDRVTEQDRIVVESQRPELLPLDLQTELHLRSDRMAIAYRKWLRRIGLRYGAA